MPFVDRRGDLQRIQELERARLLDSVAPADTVVRLSGTTAGNRRFFGGGLMPQRFLRPPIMPNDPGDLQLAPITSANARRALGRTRGMP